MVLDILNISLQGIARAVFNYAFVMVIVILFMVIKKLNDANFYNKDQSRPTMSIIAEVALEGTVGGIICSLIIIFLGIPLEYTDYLIMLLPISLVLGMMNIRYLCISYSGAFLGALALLFNGQMVGGISLPDVTLEVGGLVAFVGLLHIMEGILVVLFAHKDAIPIVSQNDDQVILGHIIHKFWPIPLAALLATMGTSTAESVTMPNWWPVIGSQVFLPEAMMFLVYPLVGILGYSTITFSKSPKARTRKSGTAITVYGLTLLGIGYASETLLWLQIVGLVLMFVLHEVIMRYEIYEDNKGNPLYPVPEKGIRVMAVNDEGIGRDIGIQMGDVITSVNGIEVANLRQFKAIMKQHFKYLKIEVYGIESDLRELEYFSAFESKIVLGIKLIPERPPILFKVSNLLKVGMVHLIKNNKIKR